jgi:hypothetical protein
MTQGIKQAISELQSQLKYHEDAVSKLSRAIAELRQIAGVDGGAAEPAKRGPGRKPGRKRKMGKGKAKPAAAPAKTRGKKLTLARALTQVMEAHRKAKRRGVSAKQLLADVLATGFRFGGANKENNMNYLYKTLRRNKTFKKVGDGLFGLA